MANTFLSHIRGNCGGPVVMDVSSSVKLVAPSFQIAQDGIKRLMLDVDYEPKSEGIPEWQCVKCRDKIDKDKVGDDIACSCQICGIVYPAGQVYVHSRLSSICTVCWNAIKEYRISKNASTLIKEYADMFDIGPKSKMVLLSTVLIKPVPTKPE